MDIQIDEIVSTVHTVDDEALLSPQVLQRIVKAVLRAVREDDAHRDRLRDEQRINAGRDTGRHGS